jgi:hypothetical protein
MDALIDDDDDDQKRVKSSYFQNIRRNIPIPRTKFEQDVAAHFSSTGGLSRSAPFLPVHKVFSNFIKEKDSFGYSLRDRQDVSGKRGFRVQVPRRLMVYVGTVFLALPLLIFCWKEAHLTAVADKATAKEGTSFSHYKHDRYVSWMEDVQDLPNKDGESHGSDVVAAVDNTKLSAGHADTGNSPSRNANETMGVVPGVNASSSSSTHNSTDPEELEIHELEGDD